MPSKIKVKLSGRDGKGSHLRPTLVPCKRKHHDQEQEAERIGYQGGHKQELCEFPRRPSSLEIATALEYGHAGNTQCENVVLNEGRRDKDPWVEERQLGHQREPFDDDLRVGGPLSIPDGGAQDRLQEQGDEQHSGDGRDIYSGRHGELMLAQLRMSSALQSCVRVSASLT